MHYKVIVLDEMNPDGLSALINHPDYTVDYQFEHTDEQLIELLKQYDAAIVRSATTLSRELIAESSLKVIARAGVGVDNIDIDAATERGIIVINAPDGNTISATEHTVAMILAMTRNIAQAHSDLQHDRWNRKKYQGIELSGKTLGVIGFGNIGQGVASRLQSFGMRVMAFDPFLTRDKAQQLDVIQSSIEDIRDQADVITVHTPLTPQTTNMIDLTFLQQAKESLLLVNVARGGIINEQDLITALDQNEIRAAALDVYTDEPPLEQPVIHHPKITVTPHLGASTIEAQEKVAVSVAEEIIEILSDGRITHAVNAPQISVNVSEKLAPFIQLAEVTGQLISRTYQDGPSTINIKYHGAPAMDDTSLITRTLVKNILEDYGEKTNLINALYLLGQQGVSYNIEKNKTKHADSNYLEVEVKNDRSEFTIGSTLLPGYGVRIVKWDHYHVDVKPEQHMLIVQHMDRPGIVGQMGQILGEHAINIAAMQLGRDSAGGQALMILGLDQQLTTAALADLKNIQGFTKVTPMSLNV